MSDTEHRDAPSGRARRHDAEATASGSADPSPQDRTADPQGERRPPHGGGGGEGADDGGGREEGTHGRTPRAPRELALHTEGRETAELPLITRLNVRGFRLLMVADVAALFAVMVATMFVRFGTAWPAGPSAAQPYTVPSYLTSFAVLTALHFVNFYFGGLYEREPRLGRPPILPRVAAQSFTAILLFAGIAFVLGGAGFRPLPAPTINLVVLFVVGGAMVTLNRWIARWLRERNHGPPRVLLVGAPDEVNVARAHLGRNEERVDVVGDVTTTEDLLERVNTDRVTDVALLSGRWLDDLYPQVIRDFESRDIGVLQRVTAQETLYGLERVREVGGMPFVPLREHTLPMSRVRFKRAVELVIMVVTLPVWLPVVALLCLYQLVAVGRPIFYRQTRVGRDGQVFQLVKFRTMYPDAEEDTGPTLSQHDDPRVVPACRWMRSTRMDELPQLWNVIEGEMSLVGPRPERPELTAQYEQLIPGYTTRYEIPPGITGLAQVQGHYETDPEYKLGYDLQYLVNWSPLLDLSILARTVWVVLTRRT